MRRIELFVLILIARQHVFNMNILITRVYCKLSVFSQKYYYEPHKITSEQLYFMLKKHFFIFLNQYRISISFDGIRYNLKMLQRGFNYVLNFAIDNEITLKMYGSVTLVCNQTI